MKYYLEEKDNKELLYFQEDSNTYPLLTFETADSVFKVSYHNANIDQTGICHCKDEFSEKFTMTVHCKSAHELSECKSSFVRLATDGFISPISACVGMDWSDLQRVCQGHTDGSYYSEVLDPTHTEQAITPLIKKIKQEYKNACSAIVCLEGPDGSMGTLENIAALLETDLFENHTNCDDIVVQNLIPDEFENQKLNIWVFGKLNQQNTEGASD